MSAAEILESEPKADHGLARGKRMAFFLFDLSGGGVQRMVAILAGAMIERGARVDILACRPAGPLREMLPEGVTVVELTRSRLYYARLCALWADLAGTAALFKLLYDRERKWKKVAYLPSLARYLRQSRPDALFAVMPDLNILAVLAKRLAGTPTRVVVSERTHFSSSKGMQEDEQRKFCRAMRRTYPQADAVTAVSQGVADDLTRRLGLPRMPVIALHNPTLTPDFEDKAAQPVDHPWLAERGPPVLVTVGRIDPQKDYPTLLRAFARVRRQRDARLIVIGNPTPPKRAAERLEEFYGLADEAGVRQDLDLLGFVENPIPYVKRASVFVLSSRYEGFPNVLLEALASGAPIVSTDCPSGPREILDGGKFGALVPVGDDAALAAAIMATLDDPPAPERQKARAKVFGYEAAIDRYETVLLGT